MAAYSRPGESRFDQTFQTDTGAGRGCSSRSRVSSLPLSVPSTNAFRRAFEKMRQHVTIAPLEEAGNIAGLIVTIEDVTPRLERERDAADQLARDCFGR